MRAGTACGATFRALVSKTLESQEGCSYLGDFRCQPEPPDLSRSGGFCIFVLEEGGAVAHDCGVRTLFVGLFYLRKSAASSP